MRRERIVDVLLALGLFAFWTAVLALHGFGEAKPDVRDADALGVLLVGGMTLPLVWRRTHPREVFAMAIASMIGFHIGGYPGELGLVPAFALYALAAYAPTPRRARTDGLAAAALFAAAGTLAMIVDPDPGVIAGGIAWVGAWLAGDQARQRREQLVALRDRAERAEREAERERRLAAAEERTRIARELHDSAGHALNVILVQAGAARLLRERDPDGSLQAIETVEDVSRATIGEIDQLVHALRGGGSALDDDALAPLPGLDQLDALVEHHRAGGLAVDVQRDGRLPRRCRAVDRAAYRIVQESLTNAARHGDGDAGVDLRFGGDALDVRVRNPVAADAAEATRAGHGITGMRERAALLGGTLSAERRNGEFLVRARLPYRTEPA